MKKLPPCPRCGADNIHSTWTPAAGYATFCQGCGHNTKGHASLPDSLAAWERMCAEYERKD